MATIERYRLIPDATFSRSYDFHLIETPEGARMWTGRRLADLLEVVAECHPEGLLVDVDGITYVLTVAPAAKGTPHG